ncbi:hypothetical protein [Sphaerisporangium perillae]|uniref:hypothetical protein n=1 Tax=Sphaerisporangium perillae TaxID=2935860 RepID=UPI00200E2C01|nr:hypothetical protein [Sphaerisporangium perillae]
MNTPAKLAAYTLGLTVIFGGAFGAGKAVGAVGTPVAAAHPAHAATAGQAGTGGAGQPAAVPGGLQVSQDGYTLNPLTTRVEPGRVTPFRFTVTGPDGRPVTRYQVEHDKKLHFIVVPRDLGGFRHLHPEQEAGGVWSVPLTLPRPGAYRMFADFTPEGAAGLTLGADLYAAGDYEPEPLPAAARTTTADGYTVTLDGDLEPGRSSRLTLRVSKDGRPVTDLQPYLGAYGHLVALRSGDLAYLHVHPAGKPGDGGTPAGPEITFYAEVPSGGDYRLFLDFQHAGTVHTAAFTARGGTGATPTGDPVPSAGPGRSSGPDVHAPSGEPDGHGH